MTSDVVLCRLVIGHETERLEKPTEDQRTHRWKVFVRAAPKCPDFCDRSFVKKVTFYLHASYENNRRSVKHPPFEITETAYGGFDMLITVHFQGVPKAYMINYEITLPMEKEAKFSLEHFLEVKNPSKEFIELALQYGGRLKRTSIDKNKSVHVPSSSEDDLKKAKKHKTSSIKPPKLELTTKTQDSKPISGKKPKKSKKSEKNEKEKRDLLSVDYLFEPPTLEKVTEKIKLASTPESEVPEKKMRPSEKSENVLKQPRSTPEVTVIEHLNEFSNLPSALSPISRPTSSIQTHGKEDTSKEVRTQLLKQSLFVEIDPEKYQLLMLHKMHLPVDFVRHFERPMPLLSFEDQFHSLPPPSQSSVEPRGGQDYDSEKTVHPT